MKPRKLLNKIRNIVAGAWLFFVFGLIGGIFWYSDWVYSLPTPIPAHYKPVSFGHKIDITVSKVSQRKPLFLHFFNPECPCSRFNIVIFKQLYAQYAGNMNFIVVVQSKKIFTEKEIQDQFGLNVPVLFDEGIAVKCGVYSTPQAVLIGADNKLFYRGNYNKSRYCSDERTNYARLAIEKILAGEHQVSLGAFALTAYGCQLPGNINKNDNE